MPPASASKIFVASILLQIDSYLATEKTIRLKIFVKLCGCTTPPKPMTSTLAFTAFLLGPQQQIDSVVNKPASLVVVPSSGPWVLLLCVFIFQSRMTTCVSLFLHGFLTYSTDTLLSPTLLSVG